MRQIWNTALLCIFVYSVFMMTGAFVNIRPDLEFPRIFADLYTSYGTWLPETWNPIIAWTIIGLLALLLHRKSSTTEVEVSTSRDRTTPQSENSNLDLQGKITRLEAQIENLSGFEQGSASLEARLRELGDRASRVKDAHDKIFRFGSTGDVDDYLDDIESDLGDLNDIDDLNECVDRALRIKKQIDDFCTALVSAADRLRQA